MTLTCRTRVRGRFLPDPAHLAWSRRQVAGVRPVVGPLGIVDHATLETFGRAHALTPHLQRFKLYRHLSQVRHGCSGRSHSPRT